MSRKTIWRSEYFCGKRISSYGLENKRVDYATLSSAFDCVLNNYIFNATGSFDSWELVNGEVDNSEEIEETQNKIDELQEKLDKLNINEYEDEHIFEDLCEEISEQIKILEDELYNLENESIFDHDYECYQEFIISEPGAKILQDYTNEVVWYNSELDMYLWDIHHYGTSWSYVLTDIEVDLDPVKPCEENQVNNNPNELPFC